MAKKFVNRCKTKTTSSGKTISAIRQGLTYNSIERGILTAVCERTGWPIQEVIGKAAQIWIII